MSTLTLITSGYLLIGAILNYGMLKLTAKGNSLVKAISHVGGLILWPLVFIAWFIEAMKQRKR